MQTTVINNLYKKLNSMLIVNSSDPNLSGGIPDAGGGGTMFYNEQPFTGIIQYFYPNGNLEAEDTYVDSHKNGRQVTYYENGQIEEEWYEKFNNFYGTTKTYYPNGVLKLHMEYNDDSYCREVKRYDENGVLIKHIINGNRIL